MRVLVVDDEPIIADTVAAILVRHGYECLVAYTGHEAVERSREFHPDLVISDIQMPGITGIEAAIQIREILPDCKVLLFSGQASTIDLLEDARKQGHAFELLAKPVHPQELLARIERQ